MIGPHEFDRRYRGKTPDEIVETMAADSAFEQTTASALFATLDEGDEFDHLRVLLASLDEALDALADPIEQVAIQWEAIYEAVNDATVFHDGLVGDRLYDIVIEELVCGPLAAALELARRVSGNQVDVS